MANSDGFTVTIERPERYWLASRRDIPGLTDPDIDDGHQRHADRFTVRWPLIGQCLEQAGAILQGACDRGVNREMSIPEPIGGFTDEEENIIQCWLSAAEAPRMDPGELEPVEGRHRLWNVWAHSPDALLPVRSVFLDLLDEASREDAALSDYIRTRASAMLTKLPAQIIDRSPAYTAELTIASTAVFAPRVRTPVRVLELSRTAPDVPRPTQLHSGLLEVYPPDGRLARYDLEAWETHTGNIVAIVTNDINGLSLVNAAPRVFTAVRELWPTATVVEHWPQQSRRVPNGQDDAHFTLATQEDGSHDHLDLAALAQEGIELRAR